MYCFILYDIFLTGFVDAIYTSLVVGMINTGQYSLYGTVWTTLSESHDGYVEQQKQKG